MAYQYGTISQDIRDIFSGIDVTGKDYVMWRDTQYDYCMYVCDNAFLAGSTFQCDAGTLYTYDTQSNQTQNNPISWTLSSRSSMVVPISGTLVFTNCDSNYPQLGGVKSYEGNQIISFAICVLFVYLIVRDIFADVLLKGVRSGK